MKFSVFFDHPFWVGVLEVERDGCLYAARHVFGAEPSPQEVYEFVLHNLDALQARLILGLPVEASESRRVNPKRVQRQIRRAMEHPPVSTKAQEAMRLQRDLNKQARKSTTRDERDAQQEHKRQVAREKARKKHRGH